MKIVVLVKHVPNPTAEWRFTADFILDRGEDGQLSELDEYAAEQAVRLAQTGLAAEVTYLTMGPPGAVDALRRALAIGGDRGVHVTDDALVGSDALATSLVLATAVERIGFDLVICGMASTDAEMSVVPAMVAERLGVPQLTLASALRIEDRSVTIRRDGYSAVEEVAASLPALVSVTDQTGEPRYPSFTAIMASRKRSIESWSLADLDIDTGEVGLSAAGTMVHAATPRPPRRAGAVVVDDGDGAAQLADFLTAAKVL